MDSLSEGIWDVVISGTGLPQALLALSLSRSGQKVLHVDPNQYYGGSDAALSIDEAESWAAAHKDQGDVFSNARINRSADSSTKLRSSRSYTLSLRPQIVYATGPFLPLLVTSHVNNQLEFLAVGSWWTYRNGHLQKVPSTREDVFADESLSRRDKVGLMKFLRHVLQDTETVEEGSTEVPENASLQTMLISKFKIPAALQSPIAALTLVQQRPEAIDFSIACTRIQRHMRSMNYFGPGFAAVYAKYGGNAEVAQVACRAGAVGGAVYLLNQGIASIDPRRSDIDEIQVSLLGGTKVRAKYIVGDSSSLPLDHVTFLGAESLLTRQHFNMIAIVSDPLHHLFPPTADNGPTPAVAVVLADDATDEFRNPLYLQLHSEDTGECPSGQCCIYVSTTLDRDEYMQACERAYVAIKQLLLSHTSPPNEMEETQNAAAQPEIIWSMSYISHRPLPDQSNDRQFLDDESGHIIAFHKQPHDLAFDDQVLSSVQSVWERVSNMSSAEGTSPEFMVFPERRGGDGE